MRKAFLYYIVDGKSVAADRLSDLGLPHLDGMGVAVRDVTQGPGGTRGVLFVPREIKGASKRAIESVNPEIRVGYYPNEQTWVNTGDGIWIGWDNGKQPDAEDLERFDAVEGRWCELFDDGQWLIPSRDLLPSRFGFDKDGKREKKPRGRGVDAAESITWLAEWREAGREGVGRDYDDLIAHLARIIGVNYRVGPRECIALGLFGPDNLDYVASYALMDEEVRAVLDAVQDAEKKSGDADTTDT